MATKFFQATSTLGQNPDDFIAAVNVSLAALGNIIILDWTLYSPRPGIVRISLAYQEGGIGPASIIVGYDPSASTDPVSSVTALNTTLAASPTTVGVKVRSVFLNRPGSLPVRVLFVLAQAQNAEGNIFRRTLKVVRPTRHAASIAAGATGNVDILNLDNTVNETVTLRNRGGIAWNTDSEGYAFYDEENGEWVGYPHCL